MKRIILGIIAILAAASAAFAQQSVRFSGTVTGIQTSTARDMSLLVKAPNGGTMLVRLGPDWFVQNQMIRIKLRDQVTVDGMKTLVNGKGVVHAYSLQLRGMTLSLRNANGDPTWLAWREEPQAQVNNDVSVTGWNVVPLGPSGVIMAMPTYWYGGTSPIFYNNGWGLPQWQIWRF
ncbi:MAG: hypothetical protein H0W86_02260 [Armatimonadetes bacterium]|nr:hypothetical protein [Armatimonadota bacterium]